MSLSAYPRAGVSDVNSPGASQVLLVAKANTLLVNWTANKIGGG